MTSLYVNNDKNSAEVDIPPAFGEITTACNVSQAKKGHGANTAAKELTLFLDST